MRVLIADDEPLVRLLLRAQFELRGAEVVAEVEHAEALVDVARAARPDVLILDYNLADGPVLEVLTELRATNPMAYLVVLSADAADERRQGVLAAGAHAYREKTTDLVQAFPVWVEEQVLAHRDGGHGPTVHAGRPA